MGDRTSLARVIEKVRRSSRNMGGCALTSTECGVLDRFLDTVERELREPVVSARYVRLVAQMTDPTFVAEGAGGSVRHE